MTPDRKRGLGARHAAARIPVATYRLQFNQDFTFRAAIDLVPYLHDLGISHVYASPILQAREGSSHGYDICDPTHLNSTLGSSEDFAALVDALHEHGMGLLLDTVPNHMGIGDTCNVWWLDVLENGPSSPYSLFFDIDWHPAKPEFQNRVLLPVLEDQYGAVLEAGKITLSFEDGAFWLRYYDLRLPVAPGTYRLIIEPCLERLTATTGASQEPPSETASPALLAAQAANIPVNEQILELQSILTAVSHLPSRLETDPIRVAERYREKEVIKRRLATIYADDASVHECLDATLADFNGRPGDPRSFDQLDGLMDAQIYRLAYWRVAGEEINYRRFFDINDLAAIRVEAPEVFQATHQLILRLLRDGQADGLRIDHPDGLWDPTTYFRRLQESYLAVTKPEDPGPEDEPAAGEQEPANDAPDPLLTDGHLPLYVVAEKILSEREPLPQDWAVHGTTGYDFLALVNNLFVHRGNAQVFDRVYSHFIGQQMDLDDLTIQTKMQVMRDSLSSEINALSHQLERIGERNRHYRDFTLNGIISSLREVIACLPVYRTYINAITGDVPERDRKLVEIAVRKARRRRPGLASALFDFIRDTLLLRNMQDFGEDDRPEMANFVMKFQQLTGPVMAKGVEDSAFYIYNRLVSLNEVGSSPDQFGITLAHFHRDNARRAERWPHSILATSTHDNKRSEDVRARINVLSEIPEMWRTALARWSRLNNSGKTMLDGALAPDRNDEYLLYQTLLGAWPLDEGAVWPQGGGAEVPALDEAAVAQTNDGSAEGKRKGESQEPYARHEENPERHAGGLDPDRDATPAGDTQGQGDRMGPAGRDDHDVEYGEGLAGKQQNASVQRMGHDGDAGHRGAQTTVATSEPTANIFDSMPRDWDRPVEQHEEHRAPDRWSFVLPPQPAPDASDKSSDGDAFGNFRARMVAYLQKAAKEAKVHTSWINPDADYDQALQSFVERLLAPGKRNLFLDEFALLVRRVAYFGQFNSLAQVLLKITAPGVPDIYQGNELWDFSLVDPDNRRPVDYARRRALLSDLQEQVRSIEAGHSDAAGAFLDLAEALMTHSPDGQIKLYVTWRGLNYRRAHADLFTYGDYVALAVEGSKDDYVCAFARRYRDQEVVVVVSRLVVGLANDIERPPLGPDAWGDTVLPLPEAGNPGPVTYRNLFTGEVIQVAEHSDPKGLPLATVLGFFPVALLERVA
jgi:(1->4)-alpha-D-glucan 1-alpha-D-glucosylmutase